jgi:predicted transcriptional regulator of viral defense system
MPPSKNPSYDQALGYLIGVGGSASARELGRANVSRMTLSRMCADGLIVRISKGIYGLPDRAPAHGAADPADDPIDPCRAQWMIAQASSEHAVVCLSSAAALHGLTSHPISKLWLAVPKEKPRLRHRETVPDLVQLVRMDERLIETDAPGTEYHERDGFSFRVTTPLRTVVDVIRFACTPKHEATMAVLAEEVHQRALEKGFDDAAILAAAREIGPKTDQAVGSWLLKRSLGMPLGW